MTREESLDMFSSLIDDANSMGADSEELENMYEALHTLKQPLDVIGVIDEMILNTRGISYTDIEGDTHKILYDDQIDAAHIALGALKTRLQQTGCDREGEQQHIGCEDLLSWIEYEEQQIEKSYVDGEGKLSALNMLDKMRFHITFVPPPTTDSEEVCKQKVLIHGHGDYSLDSEEAR